VPPLDLSNERCAFLAQRISRKIYRSSSKSFRVMLLQFSAQSFVKNSQWMREELRAIYRRERGGSVCGHTMIFRGKNDLSPAGDDSMEMHREAVQTRSRRAKFFAAPRDLRIQRDFRRLREQHDT
jgi:hypothetical protein